MGVRSDRLGELLQAGFSPDVLEVLNESDNHAGPPGRETHFRVRIVSSAFEGKTLVGRHRLVHEAVAELLVPKGVHALAIEAYTPAQWKARGEVGAQSPDCAGLS